MNKHGVLNRQYHDNRTKKPSHKYRLKRRTQEVIDIIMSYLSTEEPLKILDIGTADALMLSKIKDLYPQNLCTGMEYAMDLLQTIRDDRIDKVCADAQQLPFPKENFQLIIACSIIEHLSDPVKFLSECHRVLKKNGILIVTTPVPFWESILTKIGHLEDDQHQQTFSLKQLKHIFNQNQFKIIKAEKFMITPVGFPFEKFFENILKTLHITFSLGNQIIAGKK